MKRIISVIMLVCLLMSLGTVSAFAAEPVQISNQQDFEDFMPNAPSGSVIELGAGSYTMVEPRFSVTIRYNSAVTTISGDSDKVTFEDTNNGGSTQPQNNNGGNNDVAPISDGEITDTASLQAALSAGGTVTLSRNITLTGPVTVPAGKSVTLNLNGCTVSYSGGVLGEAMITNNGNLTVTGTGTISYTYTGAGDGSNGKGNYTIANYGSLTVENGTIEAAGTSEMVSNHALHTIDNHSSLNVTGGKIYNADKVAIRMFVSGGANSVSISGGEITGTRAIWLQLPGSAAGTAPSASLNISGGTITATGESGGFNLAIYSYSNGNSFENTEINISGGNLNGDVALCGGKNKTASETVTVTGGNINDLYSYAKDEVAEGSVVVKGGNFANELSDVYIDPDFKQVASGNGYTVVDPNAPAGGNNGGNAQTAVSNPYAVPSTGDMSNMPLWGVLFLGFAVVAVLTRKREA